MDKESQLDTLIVAYFQGYSRQEAIEECTLKINDFDLMCMRTSKVMTKCSKIHSHNEYEKVLEVYINEKLFEVHIQSQYMKDLFLELRERISESVKHGTIIG